LTSLAERYMRAETTEEEERELERTVLTANDLPEELEPLREMLTALDGRDSLFTEEEMDEMATTEPTKAEKRSVSWLRIAAAVALVACMSGLAWAFFAPQNQKADDVRQAQPATLAPDEACDEVRFDDVELDSILRVVAAHYGRSVRFEQEGARRQRLMLTWRRDEPIEEFVAGVNMFDAVRLTLVGDTIVATQTEEGDE